MSDLTGKTTGERIKHFRNRVGMTRAVLGGLVGRSAEWVKAVEMGRLQVLAGVYLLTDFYVSYQPAPELVWLVADRALAEAQEADDPYAIAGGAWALTAALREAGRWEEAITVALDGARQLEPWLARARDDDWRGMWGALQFEAGYAYARRGRHGEVWTYWERANEMARQWGLQYLHVHTSFSATVMSAHAVTLDVELRRPGNAMRTTNGFDAATPPAGSRDEVHTLCGRVGVQLLASRSG